MTLKIKKTGRKKSRTLEGKLRKRRKHPRKIKQVKKKPTSSRTCAGRRRNWLNQRFLHNHQAGRRRNPLSQRFLDDHQDILRAIKELGKEQKILEMEVMLMHESHSTYISNTEKEKSASEKRHADIRTAIAELRRGQENIMDCITSFDAYRIAFEDIRMAINELRKGQENITNQKPRSKDMTHIVSYHPVSVNEPIPDGKAGETASDQTDGMGKLLEKLYENIKDTTRHNDALHQLQCLKEKMNVSSDKEETKEMVHVFFAKKPEKMTLLELVANYEEPSGEQELISLVLELFPELLNLDDMKEKKHREENKPSVLHILVYNRNIKGVNVVLEIAKEMNQLKNLLSAKVIGEKYEKTRMMGEIPHFIAALSFHYEMVDLIIREGTEVRTLVSGGNTVFHLLIRYAALYPEHQTDVQEMMGKLNKDLQTEERKAKKELHNTDKTNEKNSKESLWYRANDEGQTVLQLAALLGQHELFKWMLELEDVYKMYQKTYDVFDCVQFDINELDYVALNRFRNSNRKKQENSKCFLKKCNAVIPACSETENADRSKGTVNADNAPGKVNADNAPGKVNGDNASGKVNGDNAPGKENGDNAPGKRDADKAPGKGDADKAPGKGDADKSPGKGDADKSPGKGDADKSPGKGDADKSPGKGDADKSPGKGDADKSPGKGDADKSPGSKNAKKLCSRSPSVIEIICETVEAEKAYNFLDIPPIDDIIDRKLQHYKRWLIMWFILHLGIMALLAAQAVVKALLINNSHQLMSNTQATTFVYVIGAILFVDGIMYLVLEGFGLYNRCPRYIFQDMRNWDYHVLLIVFSICLMADAIWSWIRGPESIYLLAIALVVGGLFLPFFLRLWKFFSVFISMVRDTLLGDGIRFVVIILFYFVAFSFAMYVLYLPTPGGPPAEFEHLGMTVLTMFTLMLGLTDLEILTRAPFPWLTVTLFIVFIVLTYVLMFNILIAIMTKTCNKMSDKRDMHWKLQRLAVVVMFEQMMPLRWAFNSAERRDEDNQRFLSTCFYNEDQANLIINKRNKQLKET